MNSDLKNGLILGLVAAISASGGFFVKEFLEHKREQESFVFDTHKNLYDEGASSMEDVNKAYLDLYKLYDENYGLTPLELTEKHYALEESIDNYTIYVNKLERYGTVDQIKLGQEYEYWLKLSFRILDAHYNFSKTVEDYSKDLLLVDFGTEEFEAYNDAIDLTLKGFMDSENSIYYFMKYDMKPFLDDTENRFNDPFRSSLNIEINNGLSKVPYPKYNEAIDSKEGLTYEDKLFPFLYAENRSLEKPIHTPEDDESSYSKNLNKELAEKIKIKFINSAFERDEDLRVAIARKSEKK